jgi:MFS family permease
MDQTNHTQLSAWRFIVWFGIVSLFADFVYEGARAVTGPFMAHLGASALLVGIVTGLGEGLALAGRLVTGPLVDKTRAYWPLAILGYLLTIVAVPLLGTATTVLAASILIIAERAGKAVRSPGKDVMLSHATVSTGRGKGFAVHEALDQIGAVVGPLVVALVLALTHNNYHWGFSVLAVPGLIALIVLLKLRAQVPDPSVYDKKTSKTFGLQATNIRSFPPAFWTYLVFTFIATVGFATFGVLSYHLVKHNVVATPIIPVIYSVTMGASALMSLFSGLLYDRIGKQSLVLVPLLTSVVPILAFRSSPTLAISGILFWGFVMGIQESTMRAAVADIIPAEIRGTAYGIFALGFGIASLIGGALVGYLYGKSVHTLIAVVLAIEVVALLFFLATQSRKSPDKSSQVQA